MSTPTAIRFDLYDRELYASPYETFRRLRDEMPLYYDEEHDYYVVSRFDDVARVLGDKRRFISGQGAVFSVIRAGTPIPSGMFIFEDAPLHTIHRALVSRLFTVKAVSRIEPQIEALFNEVAESIVGRPDFDFMSDFAHRMPVRVIGMLLGLPEKDHADLQATFHRTMHKDKSQGDYEPLGSIAETARWFHEYLDFRAAHPTDDLMTQLLNVEFDDETGTRRVLSRDELLLFLTLITGAGVDTTATAIGWAGSLLAEHPEQRAMLADNPELIPHAVEEILRFEPPAYQFGRTLSEDVEIHGHTVPSDSIVLVLPGSANRDDRVFTHGDTFDVTRPPGQTFTFSYGPHFCLGAALARLEVKVALEALLPRIPEWDVDHAGAVLTDGIDTRGWAKLPVRV